MYQKNKLKDLIYIQENKPCNEQTLNGLFRSIVEPLLEANTESIILVRLEEKSKREYSSILKRLEYSPADVYDFSKEPISYKFQNVLKEDIWQKTEFIYVLGERYGTAFIFDYEESDIEGFAQVYLLYNSKNLVQTFDIINSNSTKDLTTYQEKWNPDRRDNDILNKSIRKIVENLNETNQEFLISQVEKETAPENADLAQRLEFISTKSSFLSHEMRNLLSICNLYSTIIDKQAPKINIEDKEVEKSIFTARECIKKTLTMMGNLLLDFKSLNNIDIKSHEMKYIIETSMELAKVYAIGKKISFEAEISKNANILVDENKFLSVLINLLKNAVESIDEEGKIEIKTEIDDDNAKIYISNNGKPISKEIQNKIFEQGYTTKASGSGFGLVICKDTLQEQFAQLSLKKSDEDSTEFEITVLRG